MRTAKKHKVNGQYLLLVRNFSWLWPVFVMIKYYQSFSNTYQFCSAYVYIYIYVWKICYNHSLSSLESNHYINNINMEDLTGKHILITGGSTGIGYQIIRKCLEQGATVSIKTTQLTFIYNIHLLFEPSTENSFAGYLRHWQCVGQSANGIPQPRDRVYPNGCWEQGECVAVVQNSKHKIRLFRYCHWKCGHLRRKSSRNYDSSEFSELYNCWVLFKRYFW